MQFGTGTVKLSYLRAVLAVSYQEMSFDLHPSMGKFFTSRWEGY